MSELDDFMAGAWDEVVSTIIGTVAFTITGVTGSFAGVLNEVAKDRDRIDGGFLAEHDAVLVAEVSQFPTAPAAGMNLAIGSDPYRIEETKVDSVSYTLAIKRRVR